MRWHKYQARDLREVLDEPERLQERISLLDRDLSEDFYDDSYETRGELSVASLALRHAYGAIGRAERRL